MPTDLALGYVTGRFLCHDASPADGHVRFVARSVQRLTGARGPVGVTASGGDARVVDGVLEPTGLIPGVYEVRYRFAGPVLPGHAVRVTADHTEVHPLDLADLSARLPAA